MNIDDIRNAILARRSDIEAEGVTHLSLFGSRVRGDHRPDSDLDLLVEVGPDARFSILNLVGVEQLVSEATGLTAQAFMARCLEKEFRREADACKLGVF